MNLPTTLKKTFLPRDFPFHLLLIPDEAQTPEQIGHCLEQCERAGSLPRILVRKVADGKYRPFQISWPGIDSLEIVVPDSEWTTHGIAPM